jgi:hypothetical protein
MVKKLIDIEVAKYKAQGYETVVSTGIINIDSSTYIEHIGAGFMLLTSMQMSDQDVIANQSKISIYSPISSINYQVQRLANFKLGFIQKIKDYVIVRTITAQNATSFFGSTDDAEIDPFQIEYVKITPYKLTN